jgi:hypothetical protein
MTNCFRYPQKFSSRFGHGAAASQAWLESLRSTSGGLDALGSTSMTRAAETGLDRALLHLVALIGAGTLDSFPHDGDACRDHRAPLASGFILSHRARSPE